MANKVSVRVVRNEAEIAKLMKGLGFGLFNLGFYVQSAYQNSMKQGSGPLPRPRSMPGDPPAVQTGNLRRSAHTVAYVRSAKLAAEGPAPGYGPEMAGEMGVIVGSSTGYGLWLEVGTGRMAARPALVPAAIRGQQRAPELIEAGARAHYSAKP